MKSKPNRSDLPQEIIDQYDKLLDALPNCERKGVKNPYTSLNGNMFTFLDNKTGELCIRLSKEDLANFLNTFNTECPVQYGAVMKEYALIPKVLFHDTEKIIPFMKLSYTYATSLKPKATKK